MRGGAFLKGKEGRVGFRKKSFLAGETERQKKAFINKEGRDDVSGVSAIITKVATKRKMEKAPHKSISIPSKAQKQMMPTPKYWQPYKPQKRIKRGIL